MPAVVELSKDRIVKVAVKMVNESGWDSVNASEYQPSRYIVSMKVWMKLKKIFIKKYHVNMMNF